MICTDLLGGRLLELPTGKAVKQGYNHTLTLREGETNHNIQHVFHQADIVNITYKLPNVNCPVKILLEYKSTSL